MRYTLSFLLLFLVLCAFKVDRKKDYPQDYFRSPVDRPIYLSGTFGELRPNHFHAGIDIKAYKGRVGQALYAAAEGTVSRIKVQSGGYGNVLYIQHPKGYTTVYAHMHEFAPEIAAYVKSEQYRRKSFEVDLYPPAGKFKYEKGAIIGKLGTSGRSFGPHLHFEIRDTKTEKPINPLLFGFKVTDNIAPKLHQLKAYYLNDKLGTLATKTFDLIKIKNGKYKLRGDTITLGAWRVGFGLKAYDHLNGAPNWNGVYQVDLLENNSLSYSYEMETFAFDESRYINAHLDYAEQVSKKSYFNRLFRLPGNKLSIYNEQQTKGVLKLSSQGTKKVTMLVTDVAGNLSTLEFWVKRGEVKNHGEEAFNYFLPYQEENLIDNGNIRIYFPKGTLYEDLYMKYRTSRDDSEQVYAPVFHLHDYKTPVHRYYDLSIETQNLPESLRQKAFVAYCGSDRAVVSYGGKWENGKVSAKVRSLGDYTVMVDTKPPTITPVNFKSDMKGYNRMTFRIKDDYPTTGRAADLKYSAKVDGKWILMTYDAKNDLLTYRFDGSIEPGAHELVLTVTDDRGNAATFARTFTR